MSSSLEKDWGNPLPRARSPQPSQQLQRKDTTLILLFCPAFYDWTVRHVFSVTQDTRPADCISILTHIVLFVFAVFYHRLFAGFSLSAVFADNFDELGQSIFTTFFDAVLGSNRPPCFPHHLRTEFSSIP
ncbi:hypothetical protein BaRGS_00035394 [Batillaria attramentaria]|uniref:Uncharacterized protein n=1 Tax=Batillaria attramentaria TaxID=370345 RepID=A0ABD0JET3_9CAEN